MRLCSHGILHLLVYTGYTMAVSHRTGASYNYADDVIIFFGPTFVLFVRQRKQEELAFSGGIVFEDD